jgi:hypothetical protein
VTDYRRLCLFALTLFLLTGFAMAQAPAPLRPPATPVYTENSVLGKKRLFSDDPVPISSSN